MEYTDVALFDALSFGEERAAIRCPKNELSEFFRPAIRDPSRPWKRIFHSEKSLFPLAFQF